jgi:hypothetical protein
MSTLKQICAYTILVFVRWRSAVTTILFLILTIPTAIGLAGGNSVLPTWAWVVLLLLDLHIAGFAVYQEVVKKLPKIAELSITHRLAKVGASAYSEMPLPPILFTVTLDLINRGQETATLVSLDMARFTVNTDLIDAKPVRKRIHKRDPSQMGGALQLPYNIGPSHRETNIVYEIEVRMPSLDPLSFARRLGELQDYEIDLQYEYEGLDRTANRGVIEIRESFDDFKKHVIENWRRCKRYDLIVEAKGV